MTNAIYSEGLMGAFERAEALVMDDYGENRRFIDDVRAAEKLSGYDLESLEETLVGMFGNLVKIRKTCLFDQERQEIWEAIRTFAKAFDDEISR